MSASELKDCSRLAIHTQTNKPWTLEQCIEGYNKIGVKGISVWRHVLEPMGAQEAGRMLKDAGMRVPALVRGGFFCSSDAAERQHAIDDNRVCIDEAVAIDAEMIVLVVGAVPGMSLSDARKQVAEGIARVEPYARSAGIKLAIEPLHPMYAADKSCVNRMAEAMAICDQVGSEMVGIAVDVYHVWWDPDLEQQIRLAGQANRIFGFHLCDWRVQTRDLLTDRGLMGDGCCDIKQIRGWVEDAGFDGYNEVEVFNAEYWAQDQDEYVQKIKQAYLQHS